MIPVSTNYGEKFARRMLKKFFGTSITVPITNQDYEGELKAGGADRLTILQFLNDVAWTAYSPGTSMTATKWLGDVESQLVIDQKYYYDVELDSLEQFYSYVDDMDKYVVENAADKLAEQIDAYVLDLYTEVKAGHRVGSDINSAATYNAGGAATVTAAGVVSFVQPGISIKPIAAGAASTTSGGFATTTLAGLGISFDAGVVWYKISTFTDSDTIGITDWNDSTFTGGVLTSKDYIIEALYPKVVSTTTIYADICALKTRLDKDKIPKGDRWLVVPPDIVNLLIRASELTPAIAMAYENVVLNGEIGKVAGFKIYESVNVSGSATKGWHCLAGHKAFITFAQAMKRSRVVEAEGNFALLYQALDVYGAKVTIERRKAGADAFWILTGGGDDWLEA